MTSTSNTLVIKRLLKTPREKVFVEWVTPEKLMKWFGPETCKATSAKIEPRVGGSYQIRIRSQIMGELGVSGTFQEVTAPSRLRFTWKWEGNPALDFPASLVTVDFLAVDGNTDVQLTHEGLPNAELRDDHTYGWSGCLDKLAKVLGVAECQGPPPLGKFCWNELVTGDLASAAKFYSGVFGWQTAAFPGGGPVPYTLFKNDEKDVGGMLAMQGCPSHWLPYVLIEDVDAAVKKAAALGGKVAVEPKDIPTVGRIAVLQDPQGAAVGIIRPEMMKK